VKLKNTIILFAVFLVLLATVLLFESKGLKNQEKKEKEAKLVDVAVADILKITLKNESGAMTFQKDGKGGWLITEPLEVQADGMEVDGLAESFAGLRIERVVEAEPKDVKTYEIPKREVTLWVKGKDLPVKVLIGMENPIDNTLFAKREDEKQVVLLSSSLKTSLDKKFFDFRGKDIFKFETADVREIKVRAGDAAWAASKKDTSFTPCPGLRRRNSFRRISRTRTSGKTVWTSPNTRLACPCPPETRRPSSLSTRAMTRSIPPVPYSTRSSWSTERSSTTSEKRPMNTARKRRPSSTAGRRTGSP
jgi:hypothetical protein